MSEWPSYYILIDRLPLAVDLHTWGRWFGTADRQIADDRIGAVRVSTVFLGVDHSFGNGDPLLFETMVFGGPLNGEQWRYSTYSEAERGHAEAVSAVKIAAAKIKSIADASGAS